MTFLCLQQTEWFLKTLRTRPGRHSHDDRGQKLQKNSTKRQKSEYFC